MLDVRVPMPSRYLVGREVDRQSRLGLAAATRASTAGGLHIVIRSRTLEAKKKLDDADEDAGEAGEVGEDDLSLIRFLIRSHRVGADENKEAAAQEPMAEEAKVASDHLLPFELQEDHYRAKDDVPNGAHGVKNVERVEK